MSYSTSTKSQELFDAIAEARRADKLKHGGRLNERRVITAVIDAATEGQLVQIEADRERFGPAWQRAVASRKAIDLPPAPRDLGAAAAIGAADSAAPAASAPPDALPAIAEAQGASLAIYDAACRALAEAVRVDEVKGILDVAVAMRAYAKQAKNREAEADAIALRMRATRQLAKLIEAQKEAIGLSQGGRPTKTGLSDNPVLPTLAMQGYRQEPGAGGASPRRTQR
jgi:hypothetical protein